MNEKSVNIRLGFLGAGAMATALAKGFISTGLVPIGQICAYDIKPESAKKFEAATGAETKSSPTELLEYSDVILLAVKPMHVADALLSIKDMKKSALLISIAAGVSTETIEAIFGNQFRVVRVMPNTPMLVGCGASGFCLGRNATPQDVELVNALLSAVGITFQVSESQMNAVTGLSGSGPAFVYQMIEALSDGGVASGLPRNVATKLAAQTVMGAAKMILETGLHPGALKDMVTSPAGTTIAGVRKLEEAGIRGAFMDAVCAATERSCALGKK